MKLSRQNNRLPDITTIIGRGTIVHVTAIYGPSGLLNTIEKVARWPTQFFLIVRLMLLPSPLFLHIGRMTVMVGYHDLDKIYIHLSLGPLDAKVINNEIPGLT